jgi:hypothetical protein
MTPIFRRKTVIIAVIVFVIIAGALFLPAVYLLKDHFSETERVDANILVVEGWVPQYGLEMAYKEFTDNGYDHIVTTGLKFTPEYFNLFTKGYLIFHTDLKQFKEPNVSKHTIEIRAYSSLRGEERSRFSVWVNDSVAARFVADRREKNYAFEYRGSLSDIDSVSVEFTNDRVSEAGDRNLFVKEIIIDSKLVIPYQNNSVYDIMAFGGNNIIRNDYSSIPQLAREKLILMGIDSSLVTEVPGKKVRLNRTLSSALAFRNWLNDSGVSVEGINIITIGTHAKRTYMTYSKILDKKYKIGIISLPDFRADHSKRYRVLKTIREAVGIVYYWIILLPY